MHSLFRAYAALAISLMILALVMYAGFLQFIALRATIAADAAHEREIQLNKERLAAALKESGVEPGQISQGFWYVRTDANGEDSIGFYDPEIWARTGALSDADIDGLRRSVASTTRLNRSQMRAVPEEDLPPELRFHNKLYAFSAKPGEYQAIRERLESAYARNAATSEDLWQLAYLYELSGDYAKRDAANARNCSLFKTRCPASRDVRITGRVIDAGKRPVEGATVSALSRPDVQSAETDEQGAFALPLTADTMEKIRIGIVKRNYSEGFVDVIIIGTGRKTYDTGTTTLASPITIVTIDTEKRTVTDPADSVSPDGRFVIHGPNSTYVLPPRALVHEDGRVYEGKADVYVYEFTRETVPQDLISLDTFDTIMGYAGNAMESYGMPYIQFFSPAGEELHVRASNPLLLTYTMASFDLLKTLPQSQGGPITDRDIGFLMSISRDANGFPLTRDFLVKNGLYTFPPFWVLDRKKGVWDNVGMRLLDNAGTIQAPFYTLNDQ